MTAGAVREKLRAATAAAHARLHQHPGLSAAAAGAIEIDAYRALLARLYGFHKPFDVAMGARNVSAPDAGAPRSRLLEEDLEALGVSPDRLAALPLCESVSPPTQDAEALGALYVVEGSALGGARIARALAPVLAPLSGAGCRFFSNDGGRRGAWPGLLARMETLCGDPPLERAAIDAAVRTFETFEEWMMDWTQATTRPRARVR